MRATRFTSLTKNTRFSLQSSSSYCSGGAGRGRGRGRSGIVSGSSPFDHFSPKKIIGQPTTESKPESTPSQNSGQSPPVPPLSTELPSFSSFLSSVKSGGAGRGRGHVNPGTEPSQTTNSPKPSRLNTRSEFSSESTQPTEPNLPSSVLSVFSGAGRGKPGVQPSPPPPKVEEENRHIRARTDRDSAQSEPEPARPKLNREEAVKQALRVLSQGGGGEREGRERISTAEAWPGRGRGKGRGRGRGRGRRRRGERVFTREMEDKDEGFAAGLYLGDNADGEKLAEKIGVENMNNLVEGFEEMSGRVLPSPLDDAYLDAFHTNCMIDFEPEYLMEFESNPDIDEKPPIPLRDALDKMKPFLMAYEGIQSHEEWEEAVNEVMERVPLLKELVDEYSGPDRVTAKQQQEELERVAKTVPKSAPASVKRFANRAVLSLQSNPGWGFDKKCQFMDKLVWEVSQHCK
ncbi:uncharacterized protein LOC123218385 [Mangifera indica]|uniref:uncharacterized protein LOC123218385 n=1 Tax=Mangifera indica TaxID=29780 RepID=UPI001CF9C876|nr:uncharacterized protein LOC123218385 [Mangifera indica]